MDKIQAFHEKTSNIRNICILGHVDHGKTTVADSLIASNGIISQRMAGKMRYMDSREDEQMKGITMKSSAISLIHDSHLVNLIDSPGHIDFSSEVSTAVRLCDGAVVLVDVIEGVSAQTHAVLRQAWAESIKPVLMLNKIDRLITEWRYEPTEAYIHLHHIIQQLNVITSELFTADAMFKTAQGAESVEIPADTTTDTTTDTDKVYDWTLDLEDTDDSNIYFAPERGNVVFASAIDGWAFSIGQFAHMLSTKVGMNVDVLRKTLWGDFYLNTKTKRIMKGAQTKGKKSLFVQLVLDNVWSVYDNILINRDKDKMAKIISSLKLRLSTYDLRHSDSRVQLKSVMSQWLPLHTAVLDMIVDKLPSPRDMSEERVENLLSNRSTPFNSLTPHTQALKHDFLSCKSDSDAPVIAYVSKMFPVERSTLPEYKQRPLTTDELKERHEKAKERFLEKSKNASNTNGIVNATTTDEAIVTLPYSGDTIESKGDDHVFLAFARVFSGTLHKGQRLLVLGPKHDPSTFNDITEDVLTTSQTLTDLPSSSHMTSFTIQDLLVCMGRELVSVATVPAGNVIAIRGLEEHILKSATISSTPHCPPFTDMYLEAPAIVSVALEPRNAGDMNALVYGLKLLNQADPCVRVLVKETGEHVIVTAGEVHLERCVRDLEQRYAKIQLNVSSPIVPFKETITDPPKVDMVNEIIDDTNTKLTTQANRNDDVNENTSKLGIVDVYTANKKCLLQIRAIPLPMGVTELINENGDLIKKVENIAKSKNSSKSVEERSCSREVLSDILGFKSELDGIFQKSGKLWNNAIDKVLSFGPRHNGPNILLNNVNNYDHNVWKNCENVARDSQITAIVNGFQLATLSGPICAEPMSGVCFSLEKWQYCDNNNVNNNAGTCSENKSDVNAGNDRLKGNIVPDCTKSLNDTNDSVRKSINMTSISGVSSNTANSNRSSSNNESKLPNTGNTQSEMAQPQSGGSKSNLEAEKLKTSLNCEELVRENSRTSSVNPENNDLSISPLNQCNLATDATENQTKNRIRNRSYGHNIDLDSDDPDIDDPDIDDPESDDPVADVGQDVNRYMSGQLMSCVKVGCHKAFQCQPQRLMSAMYECDIQATGDVLGRMYGVISKRYGRVLSEELREGTQTFTVKAVLPVVESFGFSEEIRTRTSGLASPQLKFSHWQIVDVDPYWVPSTEEEYMHYGEKADSENRARGYMNAVRRRKGLVIEEKIVEHAEKQRTLKKNK